MAVVSELIEAGLRLKQQGNLNGAIEHFRQLLATYPGHARIMFELAGAWRAFGVPEQALPLYRELLALPKGQGLPPKDMPRLYTQLGATLRIVGEHEESLAIIEEGLRLHPSYRPLRAWRIFALHSAGSTGRALLDALDLMLESLAPSRWDIFEDDIIANVNAMRASLQADSLDEAAEAKDAAPAEPRAGETPDSVSDLPADLPAVPQPIAVTEAADAAEDIEVAVTVRKPKRKIRKNRKLGKNKSKSRQLGKSAIRIDISSADDAPAADSADEEPPAPAGSLKIPIDLD